MTPENPDRRKPPPGLSAADIEIIAAELDANLAGCRIHKVFHPNPDEIVFRIRREKESTHLLCSAEKGLERIHMLFDEPNLPRHADNVAMDFRRLTKGARVESISTPPGERIVRMKLSGGAAGESESIEIIVELLPNSGNIIVVGPDGTIRALLREKKQKKRSLRRGAPYEPPEPPRGGSPDARKWESGRTDWPVNYAVWERFSRKVAEVHEKRLRDEIERALKNHEKRIKAKKRKLEASLAATEKADEFRRKGELLKGQLDKCIPRSDSVELTDYYGEPGATRTVKIDVRKTPLENVAAYFKKYRKLVSGKSKIASELERSERERADLDGIRGEFESCGDSDSLASMKRKYAWLFGRGGKKKGPSRMQSTGPRRFLSSDGLEMLVGRDDRENDVLTIRMANGRDVFLHVAGVPGSHVIIRRPKNRDVPERTLIEAAHLAAHYSKAKNRPKVEVSYAPRKNVSKPRGAKPGLVMLSGRKTLLVRPDPDLVRDLKERTEKSAPPDEED